jgi:hypothetical protein
MTIQSAPSLLGEKGNLRVRFGFLPTSQLLALCPWTSLTFLSPGLRFPINQLRGGLSGVHRGLSLSLSHFCPDGL